MRVHAFLEGDKHHDEEGEEEDADQDLPMTGGQMYLRSKWGEVRKLFK